jgi:hypothetical protein
MTKKQGLIYIGDGSVFIQHIDGRDSPAPARDLTPEQVERRGREALLASGLYAEYAEPEPEAESEDKHTDGVRQHFVAEVINGSFSEDT